MSGLAAHVAFFLVLSFAIVVMGAFYAEPEDAAAFRSLPRRFVVFVGSCALVAVILLVLGSTFASV